MIQLQTNKKKKLGYEKLQVNGKAQKLDNWGFNGLGYLDAINLLRKEDEKW